METTAYKTYKWTIARYHQAIEAGVFDELPIELLKGDLVLMPTETPKHAHRCGTVKRYLQDLLGDRAQVRDGKPVTFADSEPEPDIAIAQPLFEEYAKHHPYPENIFWLIELSDASLEKDLDYKPTVYAGAGIEEYWVVDLDAVELSVFRDCLDGRYRSCQLYREGTISPLAFPDVEVSIDVLLGRDRLPSK